ncbi:hemin uptake protein HemP [Szabonella alba]|uniref:Hemin uptake protein HemP n=1 Tax=Szabonella alba TaxID=2804194 RepID=A0A8K0V6I7_9RHOB|nr:hemin uptake protein HemP [Szabonella alba]MBL4916091.1 hemin uptake protein HemP [Szabonella alba]
MNARPDPAQITLARGLPATPARPRLALPAAGTESLPVHQARQLTRGGSLARIELDGQIYALRITRAGKLILTK